LAGHVTFPVILADIDPRFVAHNLRDCSAPLGRPPISWQWHVTNLEPVKALKETARSETRKPHSQGADAHQPALESSTVRRSEPPQADRAPTSGGGHMLTINEVAKLLRLHPTTVYRLAKRGALPAFKIGYSWRFDTQDLNRWRGEQYRFPNR